MQHADCVSLYMPLCTVIETWVLCICTCNRKLVPSALLIFLYDLNTVSSAGSTCRKTLSVTKHV